MTAILESLKADHARFRRYLDAFETEVGKYETGEEPDYPLIDLLVEYFTAFPDEWHHKKEDHVYAALEAKAVAKAPGGAGALYDLHAEHERLAEGVEAFAARMEHLRMGGDLPADALLGDGRRYAEALRRHMTREESEFIPAAETGLDADDWMQIEKGVANDLARSGGEKLLEKLAAMERRVDKALGDAPEDAPGDAGSS